MISFSDGGKELLRARRKVFRLARPFIEKWKNEKLDNPIINHPALGDKNRDAFFSKDFGSTIRIDFCLSEGDSLFDCAMFIESLDDSLIQNGWIYNKTMENFMECCIFFIYYRPGFSPYFNVIIVISYKDAFYHTYRGILRSFGGVKEIIEQQYVRDFDGNQPDLNDLLEEKYTLD